MRARTLNSWRTASPLLPGRSAGCQSASGIGREGDGEAGKPRKGGTPGSPAPAFPATVYPPCPVAIGEHARKNLISLSTIRYGWRSGGAGAAAQEVGE